METRFFYISYTRQKKQNKMDNEQYRKTHRKNQVRMRQVKDFTMSILILAIGLLMFFGKKIMILRSA